MRDFHQREINYLRISVTDRCNLRCVYCMPPNGIELVPRGEILRNEEIAKLVEAAVCAGIKKVRFTGGEPLVRKGFVDLVQTVGQIEGVDDIALTTNGVLLWEMADELKKSGIKRVNISLDTLKNNVYRQITGRNELDRVWKGIDKALSVGLHPVKINTVVVQDVNHLEVADLARLTLKYPLHIRFIELMPACGANQWTLNKLVPFKMIKAVIEDNLGKLKKTRRPSGNGPANYYNVAGAEGTIGFISPMSHSFCHLCNRLRLTSDGMIRQCLYGGKEIDIKTPLRRGAGKDELASVFIEALKDKPEHHNMKQGWNDNGRVMTQIGG